MFLINSRLFFWLPSPTWQRATLALKLTISKSQSAKGSVLGCLSQNILVDCKKSSFPELPLARDLSSNIDERNPVCQLAVWIIISCLAWYIALQVRGTDQCHQSFWKVEVGSHEHAVADN